MIMLVLYIIRFIIIKKKFTRIVFTSYNTTSYNNFITQLECQSKEFALLIFVIEQNVELAFCVIKFDRVPRSIVRRKLYRSYHRNILRYNRYQLETDFIVDLT